jgi:ketosteroid isomerase-like protein
VEQDGTEETRELVKRYLDIVSGDPDRSPEDKRALLVDVLHDEICFTVVGDVIFIGGDYVGRSQVLEFLTRGNAWYSGPGTITVRSVIVDGHRAAIEWERAATYWTGRPYRKDYGLFLEARDGKIVSIREYLA